MPPRSSKNPYLVALGHAVRKQRGNLGLSQEELGFECKVHRTYIGGIERGERNPTVVTLLRITAVLKTTAAKLLRDAESNL